MTAVEEVRREPLSANQEMLCHFDRGDESSGALGSRHVVVLGWRVRGPVDLAALRGALDDVVARHEALRTTLVADGADRYQRIAPPCSPELRIEDLPADDSRPRDVRADEFLNDVESRRFDTASPPLLWAVLGRFDPEDAVLALITHHAVSDGWSQQVIIRDLAAAYAARRGRPHPELPPARQYREFVAEQLAGESSDQVVAAREYWREKLAGAEILGIPGDRPVSADVPSAYAVLRFKIDEEITAAVLEFAREQRSSPFMVLIAAYQLLLSELTGVTDVVAPTITAGRGDQSFHHTVGPLFNLVPLRTDLAGCGSFRELLRRTRATCLEAYAHELPFPELTAVAPTLERPYLGGDLAVCSLEVFQFPIGMDREPVAELVVSEVRERLLSHRETSDIPNGVLWALDIVPSGAMYGAMRFDRNQFDETTLIDMVERFRRTLRRVLGDPDAAL
ncbi:condensation domain-containing protein [Saccharopolyspora indica]|uniref:condensation domain-containing protein n=1 Tax=Saccharopolyspora indica TaxID=1229659 RepID=UPI0022EAE898|nr:condensation domain-containing protein [Saccharopolyspora indica]MDA3647012.1 condensation domain-containing protein [Saccharopolyspora indica]